MWLCVPSLAAAALSAISLSLTVSAACSCESGRWSAVRPLLGPSPRDSFSTHLEVKSCFQSEELPVVTLKMWEQKKEKVSRA